MAIAPIEYKIRSAVIRGFSWANKACTSEEIVKVSSALCSLTVVLTVISASNLSTRLVIRKGKKIEAAARHLLAREVHTTLGMYLLNGV